jgi:HlyD family secretion protein
MMKQHTSTNKLVKMTLAPILVILCLAACNGKSGNQVAPTEAPDANPAYQPAVGSITANGVLQPARQVALSFGVGGTVEAVEVEVGEGVKAGQTLATLDDADLAHGAAQAELGLSQAQLRLKQLQQPADEADVRQAQHAVDQAAAALATAQLNVDGVLNSALLNESLEDAQKAFEDAKQRYEIRLAQYERGEVDYWFVDHAQEIYEDARLDLDRVQQQGDLQLKSARNEVARASQSYQEAQDNLERLLEGADPLDLEAAELEIEQARLALQAAQADLAQATLSAPFEGIVSAVPVSLGEWALPGVMAVELIDVSRWRVETKNVGELEIARVQEGQEALVRVNAFQDNVLHGRVITISPVAVVQQGDTTYTLMIELEPTDLNLRPGMTARVEMLTE